MGTCEHLAAWFFGVMGVVAVEERTLITAGFTRGCTRSSITFFQTTGEPNENLVF